MEYKVLAAGTLHELQSSVEDYLENGYKPQGGVSVTMSGYNFLYLQAMVKEDLCIIN